MPHPDGITIRSLGDGDRAAAARLAERASDPPPERPLLGAEIEGRLLAAISLTSGDSIADPSSRTVELRALLQLRAAQLRRRQGSRHRRGRRRSRARSALPGSPPGPPSWLIAHRPHGF